MVALTSKLPSEKGLRKCRTFVPNLRAIQQNSSHNSIHQNSSHRSIRHHSKHRSRKCQWDMSVQIPECPSSPLISSFQDLRDQFSMFCPCANLWHLWFLWIFPLDFPLFSLFLPLPSLLDHDLLCLPLPGRLLACVLACIAVSLKLCSTALKTPIARTRLPFSFARRERIDRINTHGI